MNTKTMITFTILAAFAILIVGCVTQPGISPTPSQQTAEEVEVAGELNELDELDQLESELDELDWDEAEEAVR